MDTRQLETFAQSARRQLHKEVAARLNRVLTTDSAELRAKEKAIRELEEEIATSSREAVVEKVAYTWFNRFCALRYMDVNHYTRMGTVSPAPGHTQPEILQEAKQGYIDEGFRRTVDAPTVAGLLSGRLPSSDPQQEAYRLLLVGVCNAYYGVMPFMFQKIDDYTELLMPDDLLSEGSILHAVREALTDENCADVEAIGWLYQFYISEKKDEVMSRKGQVPPEDIPAVTQLFTPHWIVRYMVENSLGRLWMLNHPDSRLVERMDYYIEPEEEITDFLRVSSPEEIRLCDPAAGSGHILTYAFDLLYAIYEEEGYNPIDIPRLILEKNLTGIEIDPRAGALAGFALMMKARERDARFFSREGQPGICVMEDVTFTPQELDAYMDAVGHDLFTQDVKDWLQQFEQATTFGSLIRPLVKDTTFIRERLQEVGVFQDLFLSHTHDKLRAVLRMTEALSSRYHVAVTNPPYMGSRNMNNALRRFAKRHYATSRRDLCTMFIVRILDLVQPKGLVGMITMQSWMFLSSFEELRKRIISEETIGTMAHLGPHGFDTISGIVVSTTSFTLRRHPDPPYDGIYFRLIDGDSEAEKCQMLLANAREDSVRATENRYFSAAIDFQKIPGAPIAYWVSDRVREVFSRGAAIGHIAAPRKGNTTTDNARFLRFWPEVSRERMGTGHRSADSAMRSGTKWFPYNKGGGYRKWYGNNEYLVNWENNGAEIKAIPHSVIANERFFFKPGLTWSTVASDKFSIRDFGAGFIFDNGGCCVFGDREVLVPLLGFMNSKVFNKLFSEINPTLNFQSGDVARVPYLSDDRYDRTCINRLVQIARQDWDAYETSWDFETLPLLQVARARGDDGQSSSLRLASQYVALRRYWKSATDEMQLLEEENNRGFIEVYGLKAELSAEVPLSDVTLTCNPHYRYGSSKLKTRNWGNFCDRFPETCQKLAEISAKMAPDMPKEERLGVEQKLLDDTMREFISCAVGCMVGRYSLDKPGLILANQGETLEDYLQKVSGQWSVGGDQVRDRVTFMPDEDNVIPMLDGEWFADDISERFKRFMRVTFGEEHYEENLAFLELAINRDIRGYFLRNFYDHHCRMYNKRPIYWLFSSPKGSFNALIYMHRYRPDTVSIVLNDYLREFRTKLKARRDHLAYVERSAETTKGDKTKAVKEIERINRVLNELREYEDQVLYPLATEQVEIDLDDGVKVNYNKFGRALARVRGLSE